MTATIELLDLLAAWHGGESPSSDYRLAKSYFEIAPQAVSRYRTGEKTFSDERVVEICESIWPGDDTAKARWLLRIHADREQNVQVRQVWERLASSVAAAVLVAGLGLAAAPVEGKISTSSNIDYAQSRRRAPARAGRRGAKLHRHAA